MESNHPSPKTTDLQSVPLPLRYNLPLAARRGFEPPLFGLTGRCLTTWLPSNLSYVGDLPRQETHPHTQVWRKRWGSNPHAPKGNRFSRPAPPPSIGWLFHWWPRQESNLHARKHMVLSHACLPSFTTRPCPGLPPGMVQYSVVNERWWRERESNP